MIEPRCAAISKTIGEDLHATASIVRSWLLIEQPGPWGSDALTHSDLPTDVAEVLADLTRAQRVRVLLLRRPDRPDRAAGEGRHCFVARSARHRTWIEHRVVTDPAELVTIDFERLRAGEPIGFGARYGGPLHLVCTNGRHDPCCAQIGRPVARALVNEKGDSVWECSHVGGDRFAGNVVCLPHGVYYGRLGPKEARRAVDAYENGQILLEHYRGRAGDPFVVQAAECFLREETALLGIDDLDPRWRRQPAPGTFDVGFDATDGRRFEVRVAVGRAPEGRPITCISRGAEHPPEYSLVSVSTA